MKFSCETVMFHHPDALLSSAHWDQAFHNRRPSPQAERSTEYTPAGHHDNFRREIEMMHVSCVWIRVSCVKLCLNTDGECRSSFPSCSDVEVLRKLHLLNTKNFSWYHEKTYHSWILWCFVSSHPWIKVSKWLNVLGRNTEKIWLLLPFHIDLNHTNTLTHLTSQTKTKI